MQQTINTKSAEIPAASPKMETIDPTPAQIRDRYAMLKGQSAGTFDATRAALTDASERPNISGRDIVSAARRIPAIDYLLDCDCRIPERYHIAEHESNWIGAFDRYIAGRGLKLPITDAQVRVMGILHDIGKPLPDQKSDQHGFTIEVMVDIKDALPLDQRAFRIVSSVIANDPLGRFLVANLERQATIDQRKELGAAARTRLLTIDELQEFAELVKIREPDEAIRRRAAEIGSEIRLRAAALGIPPIELYNLHLVSYLCDVGAYTYDAISYDGKRGHPGIEFAFALNPEFKVGVDNDLFLHDPARGAMKLSQGAERLFDLIEAAVRAD